MAKPLLTNEFWKTINPLLPPPKPHPRGGRPPTPHREALRGLNIEPLPARRRINHGSSLGKTRWVIERALSWFHQFRRLRLRCERRADIHEAFMAIEYCMIRWRFLEKTVC